MNDFKLLNSFEKHPDSSIIEISSSVKHTYKSFYQEVVKQSELMQSLEIPQNSVVVIYGYKSTLESIILLFACFKCKLIPFLVETGDLNKITDLKFSFVFSQNEIKNYHGTIVLNKKTEDSYLYKNEIPNPYIGDDNNLIIVSSSGSTSLIPKKILLGKNETMENVDSNQRMLSIDKSDCTLVMLPISYSYGLIAQFFSHIYVGGNIVIGNRTLSILQLANYLKKYKITNFFTTPLTARLMLYYNQNKGLLENNLKFVTIGGDKPQLDTVNRLNQLLGCTIYGTYGLAEAGPRVATNKINFKAKNLTLSIGKPNPKIEIEIVKDAQCQFYSKIKNSGYLKIKSPSIYLGYINGNVLQKSVSNNELLTKDIAIERKGKITLLGRENEFIKIKNKPVWFYNLSNEFYKHSNVLKIKIEKNSLDVLNIIVFYRGKLNVIDISSSLKKKYNLTEGVDYNISLKKFNNNLYK